jgi:hypothetical protein
LAVLEFLIGLIMVAAVLADVFVSILLPGSAHGWPSAATFVQRVAVPAWRMTIRRGPSDSRARFANLFAPLLLSAVVAAWLALLLAGFGLMFDASASHFSPPLADIWEAVYIAGSSILTLGVSEVDALGWSRWLILTAALSGFSVITASVTFILQVQSALQERERLVLTLAGLGGRPPSGLALLQGLAALGMRDHLSSFFLEWRAWSASILHSHLAHPVLCYFHSVDEESDWLTALAAVLDASALVIAFTEEPSRGPASLMHRSGSRVMARLCDLLRLAPDKPEPLGDIEAIRAALAACGFAIAPTGSPGTALGRLRGDYEGRAAALARHFGAAPLTHFTKSSGGGRDE